MSFIFNKYFTVILILFIGLLFLFSCDEGQNNKLPERNLDSLITDTIPKITKDRCTELIDSMNNVFSNVTYSKVVFKSAEELSTFRTEYERIDTIPEQYKKWRAITTINRKEMRFMRVGDTVIVPDIISDDLRNYSVFPPVYCDAFHLPKLIIVSNVYQAYACYENGILVRFAAANTGKESTPTYPGRYSLVWKQRLRISSLDSTWELPFTFNFHQYAGNAFHQYEMPGRAASHSCVRQFMDDAEWLFNWGKRAQIDTNRRFVSNTGTPVIMLGMFDYDRKRGGLWLEEPTNKRYPISLTGDPMLIEEALIPMSQIPKSSRGVLPNRKRYLMAEDTLRARGIIRENIEITPSIDFNKRRRLKKAQLEKERLQKEKELQKKSEGNKSIEETFEN